MSEDVPPTGEPVPAAPVPAAPVPAAPVPAPTINDVMAEIQKAVKTALGNLKASETQMRQFLASIQGDVEEALESGDVMSLGYIRDRVLMRTARVSLGAIYQQRILVTNTVVSVLEIMLKVAVLG